ncbi:histidine kinase [Desulfuromonas versatilis]|uniref:Histidine kinase n=1 Tax=Desulfuromonas versatilis TaxID=2802975 RepID=A0ABM8HQG5_9BACT|nr:hypothetical protein [Desulfuromonas versatilis]BCR03049.1 histidine kinase [Desulfuromonas versatilis]
MSKFTKILVALLATAAMATPALAIDADFKGFFQARGIAYDNLDATDVTDDNARGVDQRFRLWTNAALTENVKAVFAIEVDNVWGRSPFGKRSGGDVGAVGADATGAIEIKHVYLDFNVPELDTKFIAGTQGWDQGRGYIIGDDGAGLKVIKALPGVNGNLALYWLKTEEGDKFDDSADGDYYSVQMDFAAGGWSVVPFIGYWDRQDSDRVGYVGFSVDGKAGPVGLGVTLIANDWKDGNTDGNGYVGFANASLAAGMATFGAEIGYMGDSDSADGQFVDVSNYNNFAEVLTGGKFDGRGTIGAQAVSDTAMNWLYGKLTAGLKFNDKHSMDFAYIYAESAEDGAFRVPDTITFGHEVDAYYNWNFMKGLSLTLGGGYLFVDEEFAQAKAFDATLLADGSNLAAAIAAADAASEDDAWKVGTALTYKF